MVADCAPSTVRIVEGDALTVDYFALLAEHAPPEDGLAASSPNNSRIHIVGNLPFNVASPLLLRYLSMIHSQQGIFGNLAQTSLTLSFQAEVGTRLVAPPGTAARSRLSVMAQHYCHVQRVFTIPGRLFLPPPKVDVAVMHFIPRPPAQRVGLAGVDPELAAQLDFETFETVLRLLFQQRRKLASHGVKLLLQSVRDGEMPRLEDESSDASISANTASMDEARAFLDACGVAADARPYQLTTEQCVRLALAFGEYRRQHQTDEVGKHENVSVDEASTGAGATPSQPQPLTEEQARQQLG